MKTSKTSGINFPTFVLFQFSSRAVYGEIPWTWNKGLINYSGCSTLLLFNLFISPCSLYYILQCTSSQIHYFSLRVFPFWYYLYCVLWVSVIPSLILPIVPADIMWILNLCMSGKRMEMETKMKEKFNFFHHFNMLISFFINIKSNCRCTVHFCICRKNHF